MIERGPGGWSVYSESTPRKRLGGPYSSEAAAQERLRQIEWFKKRHDRVAARAKRPVLPRQMPPTRLEEAYAGKLVAIVNRQRAAWAPVFRALPELVEAAARERGDARSDSVHTDKLKALVDQAVAEGQRALNTAEIDGLARKHAKATTDFQKEQLARQARAAIAVDPIFKDAGMAARYDHFAAENVALVRRIPESLHADLRAIVTRAVGGGVRPATWAKEVSARFGVAERHARIIARDQTTKLYAKVNRHRQKQLGVKRFTWRTVGDERVRGDPEGPYAKAEPSHFDLDGEEYDSENPDTPIGRDGEPIRPGSEILCFPGSTRVSAYAPVVKLFRRFYRGEGAVLTTNDGSVLKSTPNHPILTMRGWVPAHRLQVGDYVVQASLEGVKSAVANREDRDTAIEEVFRALQPLGVIRRTSKGGFHGDMSVDQEVDIVDVAGSLRLEHDPEFSQAFCQKLLVRADAASAGLRAFDLIFNRPSTAARRFVGGGGKLLSSLLGSGPHALEHCRRSIAWLNAVAHELRADGCARDAELLRESLHTPPVGVECGHAIARVIASMVRRAIDGSTRLDPASAEGFTQAIGRDLDDSRSLRDGVLGHQYRRVVEHGRCELAVHVYNLETTVSWYAASNLIVHNCRCTEEPVFDF